MFTLLMTCFFAAVIAPAVYRRIPKYAGALLSLFPAAVFVWLIRRMPEVAHGHSVEQSFSWVKGLGLDFALRLDGLSLLFALLISGIGTLIIFYTQGYFKGHAQQGRFLMYIIAFMASMLGVVLSNHLLVLFIFWELTSFTSYLLIGFNHENEAARTAALQAMLVTVFGGLFLLAGMILLAQAAGTWRISEIVESGMVLQAHPHYRLILTLVCIGAFTKSAQFPFHFWLPNAMQAPTPASAYLHSSTMVKAGVYLLARLHPALGGTGEWEAILTSVGLATFLIGAFMAIGQNVLKRLLAYTTVSALGAMVMLLGIGTPAAIQAMAAFVLAHAFYKAALFMMAGGITHETDETSVDRLGGLRRAMPFSFAGALLAALSMGAVIPTLGFVAKETWLQALGDSPLLLLVTAAVGAMYVVVGIAVGWKPFAGRRPDGLQAHEVPVSMRIGPLVLGLGSLALALFFTKETGHMVVDPAAATIAAADMKTHLHLWAGFNRYLLIGFGSLAGGLFLYRMRPLFLKTGAWLAGVGRFGPDGAYRLILSAVLKFATWQTRLLQTGSLRHYIRYAVVTATVLVAAAFIRAGGFQGLDNLSAVPVRIALVAILMILAAFFTVHSESRLRSILCMGLVGYGMALLFTFFGAPDLAMTQLVIETLTVILLALAFYHLPPFRHGSSKGTRGVDLAIALGGGIVVMLLVLAAFDVQTPTPVSDYYLEHSYKNAHGRNVVNVILVDFRALDTLGEITVLTIAALGASALLKLRPRKQEEQS